VLVNGRITWHDGTFTDGSGDRRGFGFVWRATS
jgi:hypothetical protein